MSHALHGKFVAYYFLLANMKRVHQFSAEFVTPQPTLSDPNKSICGSWLLKKFLHVQKKGKLVTPPQLPENSAKSATKHI